jgi:hypothetical protein
MMAALMFVGSAESLKKGEVVVGAEKQGGWNAALLVDALLEKQIFYSL